VQAYRVQGRAPEGSGRMVFHRYGNIYFLSEVWAPGQDTGQELTSSRAEKEVRSIDSGRETAVLHFSCVGR
jgi:hypothetical protein